MNNYLATIRDKDGDYDFFVIVAEDIDHAWEVARNLYRRLNKMIIVSCDYAYVHNVELI